MELSPESHLTLWAASGGTPNWLQ